MVTTISRRSFTTMMLATPLLSSVKAHSDEVLYYMYKNLGTGHIGVNADQWKTVELAHEYGFGGVNVHLSDIEKMSVSERKDLLDKMEEYHLKWGNCGLPVQFRNDETTYKSGLEKLESYAKILQSIGAERVSTWILPSHEKMTYIENFSLHRSRLSECAKILDDYGLRLGLEFVGPKTMLYSKRFPFLHTQRELLDLIDAMDLNNVGLLLDSWHWHASGGTIQELKTLTRNDIVNVHVNDAPKGVPHDELIDSQRELPTATGIIDLKGFINFLYDIKYDGPVTCEPFNKKLNQMDDEKAVELTSQHLDRLFDLLEG